MKDRKMVFGSVIHTNMTDKKMVSSSIEVIQSPKDGVLMELKNIPVAWYDIPTANKMTYPKALWECLFDSDEYKARLSSGNYYGEDDHYDEDHVKWGRVSHRHKDIRFGSEPNAIVSDIEILDTFLGRNLYTCAKSGAIGFSTRGLAIMHPDKSRGDGHVILEPETYFDICIDAVVNPAVDIARYSPNTVVLVDTKDLNVDLNEVAFLEDTMYSGMGVDDNFLYGILDQVESKKMSIAHAIVNCRKYGNGWKDVLSKMNYNKNIIEAIDKNS